MTKATASLRREIAGGKVVLFTGAGFSVHAGAAGGGAVPLGDELADELWRLCFKRGQRDGSSLADLFEHARLCAPVKLARLLQRRLRVDPDAVPGIYHLWFLMPWRRVYTLNVDDLAAVVAGALGHRVSVISALRGRNPRPRRDALEIVHLNGHIDDGPDGITFSTVQYGDRLAARDIWYRRLVQDLARLPFLFVGTKLDEAPLWQHLQLGPLSDERRRARRPRSYLVTPNVTRARRKLLEAYRIEWIEASADEFARDVLAEIP